MTASVCIFADCDSGRLAACLRALADAASDLPCVFTLMAPPGQDLPRLASMGGDGFRVVALAIEDRANAWNDYVHRLAPLADIHIFLDASVAPCEHAFAELARALKASMRAYGATALAAAGRSRRQWATDTIVDGGLNRQLYALTGACIAELRARAILMPLGLISDDGFVAYVLRTQFNGGADDSACERLIVAENAHFDFQSVPLTPHGARDYAARLKRLALRRLQNELLYPILKSKGIGAVPASVRALYDQASLPRPRRGVIDGVFDRLAMREIRSSRQVRALAPSKTTRPAT